METEMAILRLNKFIAHTGLCNRKEAVDIIKKGEITVNGQVLTEPFYAVQPDDVVCYKGNILAIKEKMEYFLINKAKNTPITSSTVSNKPSVSDLIKKNSKALLTPAGHFSDESSGLMLMTNDVDMISKLKNPGNRVKSVFDIETDRDVSQDDIQYFENIVKDQNHNPRILGVDFPDHDNKKRVGVSMIGGSISDISSVFDKINHHIMKVDCTFFGGLTKKDLKRGWSRALTEQEVIFLKHFS